MADTKGNIIIVGKDKATPAIQQVSRGFEGMRDVVIGLGIERIFEAATRALIDFASESVAAFIAYENSQKGIESVAAAFGQDVDATKGAILDYISDGLIPLTDATFAFKNLMSSGFNLQETIKLLDIMKDTAAFNRQGMFTMGQAVERASQGIKNQNSILTDSTGIQKNLSVILSEQGFSMQDLTDKIKGAGARQALLTGFVKEGAFAIGDAIKVTTTLSGKMNALDVNMFELKKTFGQRLEPAVKAVVAIMNTMAKFMKDNLDPIIEHTTDLVIALAAAFTLLAGRAAMGAVLAVGNRIVALVSRMGTAIVGATGVVTIMGTSFKVAAIAGLVKFAAAAAVLVGGLFFITKALKLGADTVWNYFKAWTATDNLVKGSVAENTIRLRILNEKMGTSFGNLTDALKAQGEWMKNLVIEQKAVVKVTEALIELTKGQNTVIEKAVAKWKDLTIQAVQLRMMYNNMVAAGIPVIGIFDNLGKRAEALGRLFEIAGRPIPKFIKDLIQGTKEIKQMNAATKMFQETLEKFSVGEITRQMIIVNQMVTGLTAQLGDEQRALAIMADRMLDIWRQAHAAGIPVSAEFELLVIRARAAKEVFEAMTDPMALVRENMRLLAESAREVNELFEDTFGQFLEGADPVVEKTTLWAQQIEALRDRIEGLREQGGAMTFVAAGLESAFNAGQLAASNFGNALADSILKGGLSFKNAAKFIKAAIGDALAAEGRSQLLQGLGKLAASIFPPNAALAKSGAAMVAVGGAMLLFARTLGGGKGQTATSVTAVGGGAGATAAGAGAGGIEGIPPQPFVQNVTIITQGPVLGSMAELARLLSDNLRETQEDNAVLI